MIRWFWRLYWPLAIATLVLTWGGAAGEARLFPIVSNQRIESVSRAGGRLCWTWTRDKLRFANSDNTDVLMDTSDGDRSYPEVFDRLTGQPWHRNGQVPPARGIARDYCILLPPRVGSDVGIVLRQTIHYRGWLGLWTVLVPLPDVVSPP